MTHTSRRASVIALCLVPLFLGSCAIASMEQDDIVLEGFDDSNYALLSAAIGRHTCIVGVLYLEGTGGAGFLLRPHLQDGAIVPAPSRVFFDLRSDIQSRLTDGQTLRVCGFLRDATPWSSCRRNDCRWFELRDPWVA